MTVRLNLWLALVLVVDCHEQIYFPTFEMPECDTIGWPLQSLPFTLPTSMYAVECVDGWGNAVGTRAALDDVTLPGRWWRAMPHPAGGWVLDLYPLVDEWDGWFERQGVDARGDQVWIKRDGNLGWFVSDRSVASMDFIGDELWALGWGPNDDRQLLVLDAMTGELRTASPWPFDEDRYKQIVAARDPYGGAWISTYQQHDDRTEHKLYRAITPAAIRLVATQTTGAVEYPPGDIHPLVDGAAIWRPLTELAVVELNGSSRWTRPEGMAWASDADTTLILSWPQVGCPYPLRVEQAALDDGTTLWVHEHRRYAHAEDHFGPCFVDERTGATRRSDGGYLLFGAHPHPNAVCGGQPWIMAVSAAGEAEWAHRVEVCGRFEALALRDDDEIELLGEAIKDLCGVSSHGWTSWFAP